MKHLLYASTAALAIRAFMSDTVETVTIDTDNGPVRINASDYNPKEHKLAGAKDTLDIEPITPTSFVAPVPVPVAPSAPLIPPQPEHPEAPATQTPEAAATEAAVAHPAASQQRLVSKIGSKYFVVDAAGDKITGVEGIDEKGYKTEGEAWTAVTTVPGNA